MKSFTEELRQAVKEVLRLHPTVKPRQRKARPNTAILSELTPRKSAGRKLSESR